MKLTVFDQCEKGDQPAQTRWEKPSKKDDGVTLYLDFCHHHTREFGDAIAGLGWTLHDATPEAAEATKAFATAAVSAA